MTKTLLLTTAMVAVGATSAFAQGFTGGELGLEYQIFNDFDESVTTYYGAAEFEVVPQFLDFKHIKDREKLNGINLNNQLMLKGLLLNNSKDVINELSNLNDTLIDRKILSYKSSKRQLFKLITKSSENKVKYLDSLNEIINSKETELVKLYSINFSNNYSLLKDWNSVKSTLDDNEIAIEFSNYSTSPKDSASKNTNYVAYIFTKNSKAPKVVPLFEEGQLLEVLEKSTPNALYTTRGSRAKRKANTKGIYDLLWSPLEKHLDNVQRIYFSPSGLLNQIPFSALGKKDQPILGNQFEMVQLSSTNNLIEEQNIPNADNTLLIGGINYNYTSIIRKNDSTKTSTTHAILEKARGTRGFDTIWKPLPGALNEIKSIEKLLHKNGKVASVWTDNFATETNFKSLSGQSPDVIHIATHGFFFENPKTTEGNSSLDETNIYKISEDPLMRSGLIFSGANYAWQHGKTPNEEDDDGILTALEISNLDLSNTDLIVLSACETGLGDIDGSEGVYGLQRAFKMAGVDYIIMSLWEVPDKETAEFMNFFYSEWITNKKEITAAFNNTQRIMHNRYKNEPSKWAAFVLFK